MVERPPSRSDRNPSACYEYIAEQYGVVFRVGDRVRVVEPGANDHGREGRVLLKRQRFHYVSVELDDGECGEWHPESLEVVTPAIK